MSQDLLTSLTQGTSLVVQRLGLRTSTAEGTGSLVRELRSRMLRRGQKKKKKKKSHSKNPGTPESSERKVHVQTFGQLR